MEYPYAPGAGRLGIPMIPPNYGNGPTYGTPGNAYTFGIPDIPPTYGAPGNPSAYGVQDNTHTYGIPDNHHLYAGYPRTPVLGGQSNLHMPYAQHNFTLPNYTGNVPGPSGYYNLPMPSRPGNPSPTTRPTYVGEMTSSHPSFQIPLQKISLPKFEGGSLAYISFREKFFSYVGSNELVSDQTKLMQWMSHLGEDPTAMVRGNSSTFYEAVTYLDRYYLDQKVIDSEVMAAIHKISTVTSVTQFQSMQRLSMALNKAVADLRVVHPPYDTIFATVHTAVLKKLPFEEAKLYLEKYSAQNVETLKQFLTEKTRISQAMVIDGIEQKTTQRPGVSPRYQQSRSAVAAPTPTGCHFCNGGHFWSKCPMSDKEKADSFIKGERCTRCVRRGHLAENCTTTVVCGACGGFHMTLLHALFQKYEIPTHNPSKSTTSCAINKPRTNQLAPRFSVYRTVKLLINGCEARALFDEGSALSFVSQAFIRKINCLTERSTPLQVSGFSATQARKLDTVAHLTLSSTDGAFTENISVYVTPLILSGTLPSVKIETVTSLLRNGVVLNDTEDEEAEIDLLIGNDYGVHLCGKQEKLTPDLALQETKFGYVVHGSVHAAALTRAAVNMSICSRFVEEPPEPADTEQEFVQRYRREKVTFANGRYTVKLPWMPKIDLSANYSGSAHRLFSQRKSCLNKGVFDDYKTAIEELVNNGFAERVPFKQLNTSRVYFMPHHIVIKPSSETTRVRLVFDASSRGAQGKSLNDNKSFC